MNSTRIYSALKLNIKIIGKKRHNVPLCKEKTEKLKWYSLVKLQPVNIYINLGLRILLNNKAVNYTIIITLFIVLCKMKHVFIMLILYELDTKCTCANQQNQQ